MARETIRLAEYAAGLRYRDLPAPVIERAKACIADTVAAAVCGSDLPWSRIIRNYARSTGPGGNSRILDGEGSAVQAPAAALANGALAHAFEQDSLTRPGAGVHPGATLLPPALAVAQQHGAGGKALITAIVAGFEVMYRIGRATGHTNEARGFHAPGTTGPFGAAVAAGHVLGLDAGAMTNALGIAGSLAGGLIEFARAGNGGMVKRLHLGRASEAGVLAASLARDGFTGPSTVLEGEFGFLRVFCTEWDVGALTAGLETGFETLRIALKRYPCHITAHTPVEAARSLQQEHGFSAEDVREIIVLGTEKMATLHNIPEPADLMLAQYSAPFCVALALVRDALDPRSFDEGALADPRIRALCRRVRVQAEENHGGHGAAWASTVSITLADGTTLSRSVEDFPGTPTRPLSDDELRDKFHRLTTRLSPQASERLFGRLAALEEEESLDWIGAPG